jgi:selenocysteine-specific elongation factor
VIITLAGHVDHGKTSLVRALTGVDTDSMAEEKARGLTIDIGFAYVPEAKLGFVDVPGHHRFIHNMVAGVAAHQYALLVVAADDGPMPQTREHLQILSLLGLSSGVIALTKIDMVEPDRVDEVRTALQEMVAGSFLQDAPIMPCSSLRGDGMAELRAHLETVASTFAKVQEKEPRYFRLPIDRAFNIRGSGTVVTGTTHSGSVSPDQTLTVFPGGQSVRVRSIRADNKAANKAGIGTRTALNLTGVEVGDVPRGSWITSDTTAASAHLTIDLTLLADYPRKLRTWTPVHVYHATTHTTARLGLLTETTLEPGATTRADLICDHPLLACAGDRLLIRDQGLDRTLGGGTVIDNEEPPARRRQARRMSRLNALDAADSATAFAALLAEGPVHWKKFAALWGLPAAAPRIATKATTVVIGEEIVLASTWKSWQDTVLAAINTALEADSTRTGVRENELPASVPKQYRPEILRQLVSAKRITQTGGAYHPPRHAAVLSPAQQGLLQRITPLLAVTQPPSVGDLGKTLGRAQPQMTRELEGLAKLGAIVRVSDNRYFLPAAVDTLAAVVADLSAKGPFDARAFRDASGIGRNAAIELLEYFDHLGYTRRQGDQRKVFGEWKKRT